MSSSIPVNRPMRLITVALAAAVAVVTAPVFSAPANASISGKIRRSVVRDRAQNWFNRNIQYSQSGTASDPDGNHTYRRDCSGFVSMAWHISPTGLSAPTTWTIENYANKIAKKNLKRGDILAWPHHHVVLFGSWANSAHTEIWLFEEANPTQDMNHRKAALSSYGSYGAYRYKKIIDG